jgi:hypothetical protein
MKRYVLSSLVTFISAFALAIYPMLDDLSLNNFTQATAVGLLFVGIRAGVKALIEFLVVNRNG